MHDDGRPCAYLVSWREAGSARYRCSQHPENDGQGCAICDLIGRAGNAVGAAGNLGGLGGTPLGLDIGRAIGSSPLFPLNYIGDWMIGKPPEGK